ncbi:MAG: repair protein RecO [Actinomycetota bacterium]
MPSYRDEGIVLRTHKLGEADRIVTLLTRQHGQIRAVAKGVRKTASKFGARLEPFNVSDLQLYEGKNLDTVNQAVSLESYGGIVAGDYLLYTAGSVMLETAERLTRETSNPQQYLLLLGAIRSLARREQEAQLVLDAYLLRALALAGWKPETDACHICGRSNPVALQVGSGQSSCEACLDPGSVRVGQLGFDHIAGLLAGDWDIVRATPVENRKLCSGVILAFAQWRLERGLKSVSALERA